MEIVARVTGVLAAHAPAQVMCIIATLGTPTLASVRRPWVLCPSAGTLMSGSGIAGITVDTHSVTATFLVAMLGNMDRLGPARTVALASIKPRISSQEHPARTVVLANTRTLREGPDANNAKLENPRAVKVNRHVASVSIAFFGCALRFVVCQTECVAGF
jgi:hypothetical protein